MERTIEIKFQVQEKKKNVTQNNSSSTQSHDLQNLRALFKILSTPSHILIVIEKLNLCFSLVIIINICIIFIQYYW